MYMFGSLVGVSFMAVHRKLSAGALLGQPQFMERVSAADLDVQPRQSEPNSRRATWAGALTWDRSCFCSQLCIPLPDFHDLAWSIMIKNG